MSDIPQQPHPIDDEDRLISPDTVLALFDPTDLEGDTVIAIEKDLPLDGEDDDNDDEDSEDDQNVVDQYGLTLEDDPNENDDDDIDTLDDSQQHKEQQQQKQHVYDDSIIDQSFKSFPCDDSIFNISYDSISGLLLTACANEQARLYHIPTQRLLYIWDHFNDSVIESTISPKYAVDAQNPHHEITSDAPLIFQYFALTSLDGIISIYDLTALRQLVISVTSPLNDQTIELTTPFFNGNESALQPISTIELTDDISVTAWHPTLPVLAIGCSIGQLWVTDLCPPNLESLFGHHDSINALTFSFDGTMLFSAGNDANVMITPLQLPYTLQSTPQAIIINNILAKSIDVPKERILYHNITHNSQNPEPIITLTQLPRTTQNRTHTLLVGTAAGTIGVLQYNQHTISKLINKHHTSIENLTLAQISTNPPVYNLIAGDVSGVITSFDTNTYTPRWQAGLYYAATVIKIHPLQRIVVIGCLDGSISVFEVVSGKLLHKFTGHQDTVLSITFINPTTMIAGSDDRSIKIFSLTPAIPEELLTQQQERGAHSSVTDRIAGAGQLRRPVVKPPTKKPQ